MRLLGVRAGWAIEMPEDSPFYVVHPFMFSTQLVRSTLHPVTFPVNVIPCGASH